MTESDELMVAAMELEPLAQELLGKSALDCTWTELQQLGQRMNQEIASASVAEGFCWQCGERLKRFTPVQAQAVAGFAHPPAGWCSTCRGAVGAYQPPGTGVFVAYGVQQDGAFTFQSSGS